jgi:hypothetical protein
MAHRKMFCCVALTVCLGMGSVGCGSNPLFDLLSAASKVSNGQLSSLTVPEVKALNQFAISLVPASAMGTDSPDLLTLSDAQAAALIAFCQANHLDSIPAIEQAIQQSQTDPSSLQGVDTLSAAFQGTQFSIEPGSPSMLLLGRILNTLVVQPAPPPTAT